MNRIKELLESKKINNKTLGRLGAILLFGIILSIYFPSSMSHGPEEIILKEHSVVGEITRGVTIQQPFSLGNASRIDSIKLLPATYFKRKNTGRINLSIIGKSGVFYEQEVSMSDFEDNVPYILEIPADKKPGEKDFILQITGVDGKPGSSITFWTIKQREKCSEMSVNGKKADGRMLACEIQTKTTFYSKLLSWGFMALCFILWWLEPYFFPSKGEKKPISTGNKQNFDWGIHYFRGLAIVFIAVGHFWGIYYQEFTKAWFISNTIYFLFISGYLCQYLAAKNESPMKYYLKKVKNVISPYLFFSFLFLLVISVFSRDRVGSCGNFEWSQLPELLFYGKTQGQFWYIPFVSILFLISPMLVRLSSQAFIRVTIIFALLAMLLPIRGGLGGKIWPNTFYLYTYFTIYYLLGILYCRYREKLEPVFKKNFWVFTIFGTLIGMSIIYPKMFGLTFIGDYQRMALQKILFTFSLLVILNFWKDKRIAILDWLAKYSFTIFFIHMFFLQDYMVVCKDKPVEVSVFFSFVYIAECLAISMLLKKCFGKWSRYFVGGVNRAKVFVCNPSALMTGNQLCCYGKI